MGPSTAATRAWRGGLALSEGSEFGDEEGKSGRSTREAIVLTGDEGCERGDEEQEGDSSSSDGVFE